MQPSHRHSMIYCCWSAPSHTLVRLARLGTASRMDQWQSIFGNTRGRCLRQACMGVSAWCCHHKGGGNRCKACAGFSAEGGMAWKQHENARATSSAPAACPGKQGPGQCRNPPESAHDRYRATADAILSRPLPSTPANAPPQRTQRLPSYQCCHCNPGCPTWCCGSCWQFSQDDQARSCCDAVTCLRSSAARASGSSSGIASKTSTT